MEEGYGNKMSVRGEHPLGDYCMDMRVPVDKITERLDRADHSRQASFIVYLKLHDFAHGFVGCTAEITEKASRETEVDTQALGNSKHPLPVRDFGKNIVEQPVPEYQSPLLVAGGATSTLLAGERNKKLLSAFGASHTGEAILKVSALHELVNSLPYNRTPEPESHAVTIRIYPLEIIKMFLYKLVKRGRFWITRPIKP